jgi:phosphohistidine phosphatase
MHLYLVQHADALTDDIDPARPLSEQGRADIERVATLLRGRLRGLSHILHSGKTRARQTAEILARALTAGTAIEQAHGLNPLDDPEPFARRIDTSDEDLMLVGHLPFMARLAAFLLTSGAKAEVVVFQPGTVLCLEGDGGTWRVAWMLRPELLVPDGKQER